MVQREQHSGDGRVASTAARRDARGEYRNAYITGSTQASDFPTLNRSQPNPGGGSCSPTPCSDAFVTKLNATGSALVYSTYLGGTVDDSAQGVASSGGMIYVAGYTTSTSGIATATGYDTSFGGGAVAVRDAFVIKLNPSLSGAASLLYGTYLGSTNNDEASAIALDSSGNAYITGNTSGGFPTKFANQSGLGGNVDAFAAKLTPARPAPAR